MLQSDRRAKELEISGRLLLCNFGAIIDKILITYIY